MKFSILPVKQLIKRALFLLKKKKYKKKSTVCLIVKNEGPYLLEWIAHHRLIGFDKIVIYNNNSTDNSKELLEKLAKKGVIDYRFWDKGAHESPQITAYKDALDKAQTEWIFFIDADEFLVLHDHPNVNSFLQTFDKQPNVNAIGLNWRLFGDSHLKTADPRPVIERFTWGAVLECPANAHLKSFIRVSGHFGIVNMHICNTVGTRVHPSGKALNMTNWGISDDIETDIAQVNHYYTKTLEEYQIKKARGQAGCGEDHADKYYYHDGAFHDHNHNVVQELSIQKYLAEVKQEIDRLTSLIK